MSATKSQHLSELNNIQSIRDELFLQAHLMKTEVKAELEELDKKWNKAKSEFAMVCAAAEKSRQDISESATSFLKTFLDGFSKIRNVLLS